LDYEDRGRYGNIIDNDKFKLLEEIELMNENWTSQGGKLTEIERKNFLEGLSAAAETLETDLTVEHLLPTLVSIIEQTAAHDEEKL
jgi:hypothetical protein